MGNEQVLVLAKIMCLAGAERNIWEIELVRKGDFYEGKRVRK